LDHTFEWGTNRLCVSFAVHHKTELRALLNLK